MRLGRRSGATDTELALPPLPVVNVVPDTAPRPPPEVSGGAPLVTCIDQVVSTRSQVLVRRWTLVTRQLELQRCFRAARSGKASLARRLRPADL